MKAFSAFLLLGVNKANETFILNPENYESYSSTF